MITVYRIRHAETGVDENNPRKKDQKKNLSALGRKNAERIAMFLRDKEIKYVFSSEFTRANETAYATIRYLNKHLKLNLTVKTTPLLNEWWIPAIWGKKYSDLNKYLYWRSLVFSGLQTNIRFDKDSETLEELVARTIKFNCLLSKMDGNVAIFGHSQYIATDLTTLKYGSNIDSLTLVKGFSELFPKRCGSIATTAFHNGKWNIIDPTYTSHLP